MLCCSLDYVALGPPPPCMVLQLQPVIPYHEAHFGQNGLSELSKILAPS